MIRTPSALAALVVLVAPSGCAQPDFGTPGRLMDDYFELTNASEWTYVSTDDSFDWQNKAVRSEEGVALDEDTTVYTRSHEVQCTESPGCEPAFLYSIDWSTSPSDGAFIHGWQLPDMEEPRPAETPIRIVDNRMNVGDIETTEGVDGHAFTSEFTRLEACPTPGVPRFAEETCVVLTVTSEPAGHWLAGTYWALTGWHVVAFERTDDTGRWELEAITQAGDE